MCPQNSQTRHVATRLRERAAGVRLGISQLLPEQGGESPAVCEEFGKGPFFDNLPIVEHIDAVHIFERPGAVGYDDRDAFFAFSTELVKNVLLSLGVDGGSWLIQDPHGRAAQVDARECQALPLTAGKIRPAELFTELAVQSTGECVNKLAGACRTQRLPHLLIARHTVRTP